MNRWTLKTRKKYVKHVDAHVKRRTKDLPINGVPQRANGEDFAIVGFLWGINPTYAANKYWQCKRRIAESEGSPRTPIDVGFDRWNGGIRR